MYMNKQFLTILYFKKFELTQREQKLMDTHDFPDNMESVRNDQSISEVRKFQKVLDSLIDSYLETK